jgi:hypothetical protein
MDEPDVDTDEAGRTALRIGVLLVVLLALCGLVNVCCVPHGEADPLPQAEEAEPMKALQSTEAMKDGQGQGEHALDSSTGPLRGQAPEEREPPPLPHAGRSSADVDIESDAMFEKYDKDKDGRLNSSEIGFMLHDNSMDDSATSVAALIRRFDTNQSGDLDKFEFRAVSPQIGYKKSATGWVDPSSYDLRPMYTSTG